MRKIWTFIKKALKRIFPPTVHAFIREVEGLHGAMAIREANLSHQLGEAREGILAVLEQNNERQIRRLDRLEAEQTARLDRLGEEQKARLDRLGDLFESANRENLRLFFDAREERREMDERYAQLAERYDALVREVAGLREQQAELERRLADGQGTPEKRTGE